MFLIYNCSVVNPLYSPPTWRSLSWHGQLSLGLPRILPVPIPTSPPSVALVACYKAELNFHFQFYKLSCVEVIV